MERRRHPQPHAVLTVTAADKPVPRPGTDDTALASGPWRMIPDRLLAPAATVPTMMTREEERLLYWLARERVGGAGVIADLGSFVGGSTARLAHGAADGGWPDQIHLFDRFTGADGVKRRLLYPGGVAPFAGEDILSLSQQLLAPWEDRLHWHPGEVRTQRWPAEAGSIALLILDLTKVPATSDFVARTFLPRLQPGAIVVQRDMMLWNQPWTTVQMLLLGDWLKPIARAQTSVVFRCSAVPQARDLAGTEIGDLDDDMLLAGIDEARTAFAAFGWKASFDLMAAAVKANPGRREPWKMRDPRDAAASPEG